MQESITSTYRRWNHIVQPTSTSFGITEAFNAKFRTFQRLELFLALAFWIVGNVVRCCICCSRSNGLTELPLIIAALSLHG